MTILKLVKGDPTHEELAALTAVLAAMGSSAEPSKRSTPTWAAHHRKARVTYRRGPGGWRNSGLPR